jgi:polyhydroxybutyrate depolymerase
MKNLSIRICGWFHVFCLAIVLSSGVCFAQTQVYSLNFGGLTRSYRLYLPANYTGTTAVPLVFNLHGYTSNAFQQEFYSGMNAVADTAGFILCYPDGVNSSWNSGFSSPYYGGVNDVGFLSTLLDSLLANYNIDAARVYSCGMSNGGFMSYRLACDLESRIAAIASVTGSMTTLQLSNCQATRAVPVLEIHGTNDGTVSYGNSGLSMGIDSVLGYWRSVNGCTAPPVYDTLPDLVQEQSTVTTQWYGGCTDNVEVAHYKIENGGHTWPGAPFQIPGAVTNMDINASVEIWKFFYRFSHPNPVLTGISTQPKGEVPVVIPNPAKEHFRVLNLVDGAKLTLVDLSGKEVGTWQTNAAVLEIETAAFVPGIYFLKVNQDGATTTTKILIAGE